MDTFNINAAPSVDILSSRGNDIQEQVKRTRWLREMNLAPGETKEEKMQKTADEFESFFMFQVLELMQPKIDADNNFNGGYAEEMFRHTLNEEIAKEITKQGGLGISDVIYKQLLQYQEVQ